MNAESILLIEENNALASMIHRALQRCGYDVTVAQNGMSALTIPEDQPVDLVVLDRDLSVLEGRETALRLRQGRNTYYLPVLLLVPREEVQTGESPSLYGADDYIEVPTDIDRLLEKVRAVLDTKKSLDEARELLYTRVRTDIEAVVEDVIRETFQDKAEEMLRNLSAGLVDLLEGKAREGLEKLVADVNTEELEKKLAGMVQDAARPVVEEIANETVNRISADILEDRSEEMMGRMEREELPALASSCFSSVMESEKEAILTSLLEEGKKTLVEDLKENLPSLAEHIVRRAVPGAVDQTLPDVLGDRIEKRVDHRVRESALKIMEREVFFSVREFAKKRLVRRFYFALGVSVVLLAVSVLAILKYAPALLELLP